MGCMELKKFSQGGRPSKGDRHTFLVKLDIPRAHKLRAILEALDGNAVDYLTPLVAAHLDSIDVEALKNQETLLIDKAG